MHFIKRVINLSILNNFQYMKKQVIYTIEYQMEQKATAKALTRE